MVSVCQAHISYTVTLKHTCVLHLMWDLVYGSRCVQIFASLQSSCLSRSKLDNSQSFGLIILVYCFPTKSMPKLKGSKECNFTHQQFGNDFYLFYFIKYLKVMNNIFTIEKSRYSFSVPQLFIQFRYSLNIRLLLLHHFHEFSFSIGIKYSTQEMDFPSSLQVVNPSVSLWTTPRETVHHVLTGGQPIVHENIMHIFLFTSVIHHLFIQGFVNINLSQKQRKLE